MGRPFAAALVAALALSVPALADDGVTPEAVITKVREAAAHLAKEGAAGLSDFETEGSPFVWDGTYVFVYDCAKDVIAAHPIPASRELSISGLKGADGVPYGMALCKAAEVPGGSWGEYVWPKPVVDADGAAGYSDEAYRKVSYMISVEGQPFQVGAGIYNEAMTLAELDALVPKD